MKKTILRIVFLVMVSTNCIAQENVSKVSLKTQNDSINYDSGNSVKVKAGAKPVRYE